MDELFIIIGAYVSINLLFVPFQYRYIKGLEEMKKKKEGDIYRDMTFQELQLHYHNQANFLIILATLMAFCLYSFKNKKSRQTIS